MEIKIFDDAVQACTYVAGRLSALAGKEQGGTVALSGGSTPKLLFKIMRQKGAKAWKGVKFFWGDERIVPAESRESNWGEFYRELVVNGIIGENSVFPSRFSSRTDEVLEDTETKIKHNVQYVNGFPRFDLIILGLGEDGHTASIFPDNLASFSTCKALEIVNHPTNGQQRITLSGNTINNAREIIFLCTGENKSEIIYKIFINNDLSLPATHVVPVKGKVIWCLDESAATKVKEYNLNKAE